MAVPAIVREAEARGITLRVVGDKVRLIGPEADVEAILPRVREEKEALLRYFANHGDIPYHVKLCRFVDEAVETKYGRGRLWQVFEHRAAVVLHPSELTFMHPTDVFLDPPGAC